MKKIAPYLFGLALAVAVLWACKSPKLKLDYRMLVYVQRDSLGVSHLGDSVMMYVFYADTAEWKVASYPDAKEGRITSKYGNGSRSYQLMAQRMIPVANEGEIGYSDGNIGGTDQAVVVGPLREKPVLIVVCDVEHRCYAWRQVEIAAGLDDIYTILYFRPWKIHPPTYVESRWNFVNELPAEVP